MESVLDLRTILLIIHVFGAVIGAGGAYMSDAMFLTSVKDEHITSTELRFLKLGSVMVWTGLALLVLSGIGIFSESPAKYLASSKFLIKMTIVCVIIINGIVFHLKHFPLMFRHAGAHFPSSSEFIRQRPFILVSGAISVISWSLTIILGMVKSLPWSYGQLLVGYLLFIAIAAFVSHLLRERILPHHGTVKK